MYEFQFFSSLYIPKVCNLPKWFVAINEPVYIYDANANENYYLLKNDQNTVLALYQASDTTGSVPREQYEYSSYGITNILDQNGLVKTTDHDLNVNTPEIKKVKSDFANPFGYHGMWRDEHTGLYHTHYRLYDPQHVRWLTPDPAGYRDGQNLYRFYAGPNGVDVLGLENLGKNKWKVRAGEDLDSIHSKLLKEKYTLSKEEFKRRVLSRTSSISEGDTIDFSPTTSAVYNTNSTSVNLGDMVVRKVSPTQLAEIKSSGKLTAPNPNGTNTAVEHFMNWVTKQSKYISASDKLPSGASGIDGIPIFFEKGAVEGKVMTNTELIELAKEYAKENPSKASMIEKWIKAQSVEGEVLIKGQVKAEKITVGKGGLAVHALGKGLFFVGVYNTGNNLANASIKSVENNSMKPVVAQAVREAGGWGGAIAAGTAAATYTAAATSISGPFALGLGLVAGIGGGWIGYNAADVVADEIDED